jgi:hypothetical protein
MLYPGLLICLAGNFTRKIQAIALDPELEIPAHK